MKETVLSIKEMSKSYGQTLVLDKVNLEVEPGQIYGLLGDNGAGKTSLMRLIAGHSQGEGDLALWGEGQAKGLQKNRKRMGVLIDQPGFISQMTARQNLEYFRRQFGIPGQGCIDEVLKAVGLDDQRKKKYEGYSQGMKQRLGIALALLHKPEFLVLDEPINGLDPKGIISIRKLLQDLQKRRNTSLLISSHILSEVANLATHYAFIKAGRIVETISAEDLKKKCNVYIDIHVKAVKGLCVFLEQDLKLRDYKVYPDNHIHLYEGFDKIEAISQGIVEKNLGLLGIQKHVVDLEQYYMTLMEEA